MHCLYQLAGSHRKKVHYRMHMYSRSATNTSPCTWVASEWSIVIEYFILNAFTHSILHSQILYFYTWNALMILPAVYRKFDSLLAVIDSYILRIKLCDLDWFPKIWSWWSHLYQSSATKYDLTLPTATNMDQLSTLILLGMSIYTFYTTYKLSHFSWAIKFEWIVILWYSMIGSPFSCTTALYTAMEATWMNSE